MFLYFRYIGKDSNQDLITNLNILKKSDLNLVVLKEKQTEQKCLNASYTTD